MYPLRRVDERSLPKDAAGCVFTCDVDKTYLETRFSSARGLIRIPFEWAEDKKAVPGMAPVLRAIRFGPGRRNRQVPFYFLTASPPFLARELMRKMLRDGVQADGITFKDWGAILAHRRPGWIRRQTAYKLCALLHQRTFLPDKTQEILIGDDAESDAVAYALYADICAGRLGGDALDAILAREKCDGRERREVLGASANIGRTAERVRRAYILLARGSDPRAFLPFGDGIVACRGPFQLACHLAVEGLVRPRAAEEAAKELIAAKRADIDSLTEEAADGLRRSLFTAEKFEQLAKPLRDGGLIKEFEAPDPSPRWTAPRRENRGGIWYPPGV
ncbi:MAG: hypothetical protein M5R36_23210 [Deltaproteobacteria bacterium]|nr:hypothetical protein [Deltaproteobacteria bacterium]